MFVIGILLFAGIRLFPSNVYARKQIRQCYDNGRSSTAFRSNEYFRFVVRRDSPAGFDRYNTLGPRTVQSIRSSLALCPRWRAGDRKVCRHITRNLLPLPAQILSAHKLNGCGAQSITEYAAAGRKTLRDRTAFIDIIVATF